MPTTYVLPVYDEIGQRVEYPLLDSLVGYQRFAFYIGSTAYEVTSVPDAAPPTGEFPVYAADGSTVLFTVAFVASTLSSGFEEAFSRVSAAVSQSTASLFPMFVPFGQTIGVPTTHDNAPHRQNKVPHATLNLEPVGVELLERDDASLVLRHRATLEYAVRVYMETGLATSLTAMLPRSVLDGVPGVHFGPSTCRRDGPEVATLTSETNEIGPMHVERLLAQFHFDVSVPRPSSTSSTGNDFLAVAKDVQSAFASFVSTPLTLMSVADNAPGSDPGSTETSVSVEVDQGEPLNGGLVSGAVAPGVQRRRGSLRASVTTPLETGTSSALRVVDQVVRSFAFAQHGAAMFDAPSVTSLGSSGRFWELVVDCPFYVDEPRSS
jgi:hypothetical protein